VIGRSLVISITAAGFLVFAVLSSRAEAEENLAELAKALPEANVSLDQGLRASEREGKAISAKYEMENGALQLSVYTMKDNKFSEVIVDHKSGAIKNAEPLTDAGEIKDSQEQSAAMAKAKLPLDAVVASAVKANSGYRAVSIIPMLDGAKPVAAITLMKGEDVKKVTEKLD
jgi:hypothetical protein